MMDLLYTTLAVMLALLPFTVSVMIKMDILYAAIGLIITMGICYNILRNWFDQYRIKNTSGKYVLITGCDSGFGKLLAQRLSNMNINVIAGCLLEESVQQLTENHGDNMIAIKMDVSKPESVKNAYNILIETHPAITQGVWGIINNAGILGNLLPSEWLQCDDFIHVFKVNALGMVNVTNTFLPLVRKVKGRIVNTASYLSRISPPNSAPYCMSKYAVRSYTDCLRRELSAFGIKVSTIEPGAFNTNLINHTSLDRSGQQKFDNLPTEIKEQWGQEYLTKYNEMMTKATEYVCSSNTQSVVDAYEHALFGTYPRQRYRIGMDSRLCSLLSLLPDWFLDIPFSIGAKPKGAK